MQNPRSTLPVFFCLLVGAAACDQKASSSSSPTAPSAKGATVVIDVEASEAADLVAQGKVAVLDVRTPAEYQAGHIAGAVLADIRSEDFKKRVASLSHEKPFVVHCAAGVDGGRSRRAIDALKAAGASKIYHLNGGINAWIAGRHPVQK